MVDNVEILSCFFFFSYFYFYFYVYKSSAPPYFIQTVCVDVVALLRSLCVSCVRLSLALLFIFYFIFIFFVCGGVGLLTDRRSTCEAEPTAGDVAASAAAADCLASSPTLGLPSTNGSDGKY